MRDQAADSGDVLANKWGSALDYEVPAASESSPEPMQPQPPSAAPPSRSFSSPKRHQRVHPLVDISDRMYGGSAQILPPAPAPAIFLTTTPTPVSPVPLPASGNVSKPQLLPPCDDSDPGEPVAEQSPSPSQREGEGAIHYVEGTPNCDMASDSLGMADAFPPYSLSAQRVDPPGNERPQTPSMSLPPATAIERLIGARIRMPFGTASAAEEASGMTASETKMAVLYAERRAKADTEDQRSAGAKVQQQPPRGSRPASARRSGTAAKSGGETLSRAVDDSSQPASTLAPPPPTLIERTIGARVRIPYLGTAAATEEALGIDAHVVKASVLAAEAQARASRRAIWNDDS